MAKPIEVHKVSLAYRQRKDQRCIRGLVQSAHRLKHLIFAGILIAEVLRGG